MEVFFQKKLIILLTVLSLLLACLTPALAADDAVGEGDDFVYSSDGIINFATAVPLADTFSLRVFAYSARNGSTTKIYVNDCTFSSPNTGWFMNFTSGTSTPQSSIFGYRLGPFSEPVTIMVQDVVPATATKANVAQGTSGYAPVYKSYTSKLLVYETSESSFNPVGNDRNALDPIPDSIITTGASFSYKTHSSGEYYVYFCALLSGLGTLAQYATETSVPSNLATGVGVLQNPSIVIGDFSLSDGLGFTWPDPDSSGSSGGSGGGSGGSGDMVSGTFGEFMAALATFVSKLNLESTQLEILSVLRAIAVATGTPSLMDQLQDDYIEKNRSDLDIVEGMLDPSTNQSLPSEGAAQFAKDMTDSFVGGAAQNFNFDDFNAVNDTFQDALNNPNSKDSMFHFFSEEIQYDMETVVPPIVHSLYGFGDDVVSDDIYSLDDIYSWIEELERRTSSW